MMKRILSLLLFMSALSALCFASGSNETEVKVSETISAGNGKYLVIYYSRSGNTKQMVDEIVKQTGAATLEVIPQDDYSDYTTALNLCQSQQNSIDNSGTYPVVKNKVEGFDDYDTIFICTPLWWSRMSIPMQSFLHSYSDKLVGKQIFLGVTSASSNISNVIADGKRLLPNSTISDNTLWINNSQRSLTVGMTDDWIESLHLSPISNTSFNMDITINGKTLTALLVDNTSTAALKDILEKGNITYEAHDFGNFEKVGDIGHTLPQNNESIITNPGDIILYQGTNICIYYDTNTWNFTRLGKIDGITQTELKKFLNASGGNVTITLSLGSSTGINSVMNERASDDAIYDLNGRKMVDINQSQGIYISKGKKFVKK
jgi:flavodoxin